MNGSPSSLAGLVQMVPLEALVIPLFLQVRDLQLLNTILGLSIVYVALSLPLAIWMMRGFVVAVPKEVEEAAYIDGASWLVMFWKVLFPLVAPGLVATAIFSFIVAWNEFVLAISLTSTTSSRTVPAQMSFFVGPDPFNPPYAQLATASVIVTLPVIVIVLLFQRKIVAGLTSGAVKG